MSQHCQLGPLEIKSLNPLTFFMAFILISHSALLSSLLHPFLILSTEDQIPCFLHFSFACPTSPIKIHLGLLDHNGNVPFPWPPFLPLLSTRSNHRFYTPYPVSPTQLHSGPGWEDRAEQDETEPWTESCQVGKE